MCALARAVERLRNSSMEIWNFCRQTDRGRAMTRAITRFPITFWIRKPSSGPLIYSVRIDWTRETLRSRCSIPTVIYSTRCVYNNATTTRPINLVGRDETNLLASHRRRTRNVHPTSYFRLNTVPRSGKRCKFRECQKKKLQPSIRGM